MFHKLVAIEPVSLVPSAEEALHSFANEVIMYSDIPEGDDEVAARIGDADAVLLSYTSRINRYALEKCPNVKYIGMCCSLYSPESANVDIRYANQQGITVTGIRDYGDEGVVEYVISELVRCLHGFGQEPWDGMAREITGLKVGVVGLGKSGGMIADTLNFLGADIAYYARSEKKEAAAKGYRFMPLNELLAQSEVVFVVSTKIQFYYMMLNSKRLETKRYCSIPACRRHGMNLHLHNGSKEIIFVFVIRWVHWEAHSISIIRMCVVCRYQQAALARRLTA